MATLLFATILSTLHYEIFWSDLLRGIHYRFNTYYDAIDLVYSLQEIYSADSLRRLSATAHEKAPTISKSDESIQIPPLRGSAKKD